ncbi:angiopoietin-related protein 1-like [Argopecten irradians]|uniref:angiopoietin-related protein 1-like n=1 Tax=Argopecten irradians TaxID=31199 RepID=UPI003716322E
MKSKTNISMVMCLNGGVLVGGVCQCVNGYIGSTCERLMEDCTAGVPYYPGQEGPFLIQPSLAPGPIWTWCWMDYDYRTYLQQRHYQTSITFDRDWASYRDGFGSLNGTYNMNFWWGNMNAYYLTNSRTYDLVIQAVGQDYNDIGNIVYTDFVVHSEGNNFAMTYSSVYIIPLANHLTLPMNDSLASSGTNFSTYDSDRDQSYGNCAATHGAGWWFDNCTDCNPNGVLWPNGNNVRAGVQNEFFWNDGLSGWSAWGTSLWFTNPH